MGARRKGQGRSNAGRVEETAARWRHTCTARLQASLASADEQNLRRRALLPALIAIDKVGF